MSNELVKTLSVLRRISSISAKGFEPDDSMIVGDVHLVVWTMKSELAALNDNDVNEPRLLLSLAKFYQCINDEERSLALFQRAALHSDQPKGFYTDIGHCAVFLYRSSISRDFSEGIKASMTSLASVCPFPECLQQAIGTTFDSY